MNYTGRKRCPETKRYLTRAEYYNAGGVCPHCGHVSGGTITHSETEVGTWHRRYKFFGLIPWGWHWFPKSD